MIISPIPSSGSGPVARPVSAKRIQRLRLNWFVVGSVFGVGVSFFMNLLVTAVIVPEYQQVMARHGKLDIAELGKKTTESALALTAAVAMPQAPEYPRKLALTVANGDTLLDMLVKQNVQPTEAHNIVAALRKDGNFNPRSLRIGQQISITLGRHEQLGDKAAVEELAIKLPNLSTVELERLKDGAFNVAATREELFAHASRGYGVVKSSLFQAGADAGIPDGAMAELVKAFSYDVDFQRDIHPGDKVEALFDKKTTKDGQVGGYEDLRYAALTLRGKKHEIFHFNDNWYDANGNSIKKSLLRTPVNAVRISSGFGMRRHPILGYSKMHRGVDFAARAGTPIMAAGDGVIAFRGWRGGYGNYVQIKHNGTYSTAYGHMSRFGNIRQGARVKQGQIIGYVGSTGQSTGPHLHYEVLAGNAQVNPQAKQFNMASGLTGAQLAQFKTKKGELSRELASLSGHQQLASR